MTIKFKVLIVDDERLARKDIRNKLSSYNNIEVIAEAEDVESAAIEVKTHLPDVIFLDIQMPGNLGFELLEKIPPETKVIFVTAYDEYAIRAFEVNALDYLLKPIEPERLEQSISRLSEPVVDHIIKEKALEYSDHLLLVVDNHLKFLKIDSIIYISACGNYTEVFTVNHKKSLTLKSLKEWENRLPGKSFCRIHRSTIININFIDRIEDWMNYSYRVYLKEIKEPLILSRRYAHKLKEIFG
ncbi:MAG: LytTR family DNA-binding domain-containing protein [bacterium]